MKKIVFSIITALLFLSCDGGSSKDQLISDVRNDINVELQKQASSEGVNLSIGSFDLVHRGGKEYSGILKTTEDGEDYTYVVDVIYDGDSFMWEIVD